MRNRTRIESIDEIAAVRATLRSLDTEVAQQPDSANRELTPAEIAMSAAQEALGQYWSPHVRHGIEVALGTYTTELTRQQEQGEL